MTEQTKAGVLLGAAEIEALLPHRYPMLLVDRILELEPGKRIVGTKSVTMNEWFFPGHFPGHPIMPGVLVVEAMAQCGGVLFMKMQENPKNMVFYFMGIDNCKFRRPVVPGDTLRFEVTVDKLKARICKLQAKAFVEGELVCEAELLSMVVEK